MKKLYIIGAMALGFTACKPNMDTVAPSNGNVDVTYYVAVGNSLTAGFMDGSLYREGQENSFPAILNKQFAEAAYTDFVQPLLPGQHGYPGPKFILTMRQGLCDNSYGLTTVPFPGALDSSGSGNSIAHLGPFNNIGIPGIRAIDYVKTGWGAFNPYARRFFTSPALVRPIDEVTRRGHTVFTVWEGANDVFAYASGGGESSPTPISNVDTFRAAYDTIVSRMLLFKSPKGVILNIPDVTSIPYFNTIPLKGLTLTQRQANDLNDAYNNTNIRFTEGASYFLIEDANVPGIKMRLVREGEYMLMSLPLDSVKCAGWGTRKPIPAQYVLTADEVAKVKEATATFNQIIAETAAKHDLPLVDMYAYIKTIESGIKFNAVDVNTKYISGGAFSLDGIHLTPRGNALVANQVIMALNNKYGSSFATVDINNYRGIRLP